MIVDDAVVAVIVFMVVMIILMMIMIFAGSGRSIFGLVGCRCAVYERPKAEKLWENNNPHALEFTCSARVQITLEHRTIVGFDVGVYNPRDFYNTVF